jgi:hypothetical protein
VTKPSGSPVTPAKAPLISSADEWVDKAELLRRLNIGATYFDKLNKKGLIPRRKYSRKLVRYNPAAVNASLSKLFDVGGAQ